MYKRGGTYADLAEAAEVPFLGGLRRLVLLDRLDLGSCLLASFHDGQHSLYFFEADIFDDLRAITLGSGSDGA